MFIDNLFDSDFSSRQNAQPSASNDVYPFQFNGLFNSIQLIHRIYKQTEPYVMKMNKFVVLSSIVFRLAFIFTASQFIGLDVWHAYGMCTHIHKTH